MFNLLQVSVSVVIHSNVINFDTKLGVFLVKPLYFRNNGILKKKKKG